MNTFNKMKVTAFALLLASCGPSETRQAHLENQTGIRLGKDAHAGDEIAIGTVGIRGFRADGMTAYCSGSLLPNNLVVTAAHCIETDMSMYVVFSTETNLEQAEFLKMARAIDGVAIHPEYKKNLRAPKDKKAIPAPNNDIALVHYRGNTPANYQPVQLLTDYNLLKEGSTITIAGYGISDDSGAVQAAKQPNAARDTNIMDTSGVGKLRYTDVKLLGSINSSEVLLDQTQGTGACQGDSGGPSYIRLNHQLYMFGVASRGSPRAPGSPCLDHILYTTVKPYAGFLDKASKRLIANLK